VHEGARAGAGPSHAFRAASQEVDAIRCKCPEIRPESCRQRKEGVIQCLLEHQALIRMNYLSATARKVTVFAVGAVAGLFFLSGCGQVITLIPTSTPVPEPAATFSPPSSPTPVSTATPAPFTPPPTATMTATPEPTIYLVAPGDTLARIAEQTA